MANLLAEKQNVFFHDYTVLTVAGAAAGVGLAALPPVREAIGNGHDSTTITLSCGKLTTGVTVPQWSAILMLRNLNSPETYFQAAFRVQSPWSIKNPEGDSPNEEEMLKPACFVFDFAPTRALRQVVEYGAGLSPEGFATLWNDRKSQPATSMDDLIEAGESETVEFKSTARVNLHTGQVDPKMEHVIVKTVSGLLNHEGGTLLVGVADDGQILGIEHDLHTFGAKGNTDTYELHLRQLLDVNLSVVTAQIVRIRFHSRLGRQVCAISVAASAKPVFAKPTKGSDVSRSEFWVRVGNATKQFHGDSMVEYQQQHWGS